MKASDLQFAAAIARAISVDSIRGKVVDEFSDFFVINEADGRLHLTGTLSIDRRFR